MNENTIINFACPHCQKLTKFYLGQKPFGRTKKCKKCHQNFLLDDSSVVSEKPSLESITSILPLERPANDLPLETSVNYDLEASIADFILMEESPAAPMQNMEEGSASNEESNPLPKKNLVQKIILALGKSLKSICQNILAIIMNVRVISISLALVLFGIYVYQENEKRELLREYVKEKYHIDKYNNYSPQGYYPGKPEGKVLVIEYNMDKNTFQIEDTTFSLPSHLSPKNPEEIGIVVFLYKSSEYKWIQKKSTSTKVQNNYEESTTYFSEIEYYEHTYKMFMVDKKTEALIGEGISHGKPPRKPTQGEKPHCYPSKDAVSNFINRFTHFKDS